MQRASRAISAAMRFSLSASAMRSGAPRQAAFSWAALSQTAGASNQGSAAGAQVPPCMRVNDMMIRDICTTSICLAAARKGSPSQPGGTLTLEEVRRLLPTPAVPRA